MRIKALFLLWPALILVLLAACSPPPPEQALRDTIARMQAAAEARDAKALTAFFAEDFAGPGGMDRDQFRRYLAVLWMRNRAVGATLGPLQVERTEGHATVRFTAAVTGGDGLLPDRGRVLDVRTGWRQVGDDWELISAEWE